jgi:putative hydrolase of the HAD superfamily
MLRRLLARLRIVPGRAVLVEDTVSHLKAYAGVGIRTAWVTGYLRSMTPSFPQSLQAQEAARVGSEAARDAAVRTTLAAESRSHADHAAQEHSVTLVAAESQVPVAPATGTRARARTHHRPGHVDVKVQYADQLRRRMRRNGS